MADDFIELGIEGVDKLVDKHFDKVPDDALHIHTYHPKYLRSKNRQERRDSKDSSGGKSERDEDTAPRRRREKGDMAQSPRQKNYSDTYSTPSSPYPIPAQYSHEPPRMRPQYMPSPPPSRGGGGPPYSAIDRRRDWDDNYYSDSPKQSRPSRPKIATRRSSSYHGPRDRYRDESSEGEQQLVRRRRDSTDSSKTGKMKDLAHRYDLKNEIGGRFTKSPAGVTGGIAGAMVGGWAAKKLQTAGGHDGKYGKKSNAAITALGAAVGGLAVNVIIDRWEDKKEVTNKAQDRWEEKFGESGGEESEGDDRDGDRDRRRERGDPDRRSRRERGSRDRDSRDRGYRGERDGRSYQAYN